MYEAKQLFGADTKELRRVGVLRKGVNAEAPELKGHTLVLCKGHAFVYADISGQHG